MVEPSGNSFLLCFLIGRWLPLHCVSAPGKYIDCQLFHDKCVDFSTQAIVAGGWQVFFSQL
jgi:hypothetical protein